MLEPGQRWRFPDSYQPGYCDLEISRVNGDQAEYFWLVPARFGYSISADLLIERIHSAGGALIGRDSLRCHRCDAGRIPTIAIGDDKHSAPCKTCSGSGWLLEAPVGAPR